MANLLGRCVSFRNLRPIKSFFTLSEALQEKRLRLRLRADENRDLHCHRSDSRTVRWRSTTKSQRTMELERRSAKIN
jgi:hypothetical protein